MTERFSEPFTWDAENDWVVSGDRIVLSCSNSYPPDPKILEVLLSDEFRRMLQKAHGEGPDPSARQVKLSAEIVRMCRQDRCLTRLSLEGPYARDVSNDWLGDHLPVVGGFYVEYEDGTTGYRDAEPENDDEGQGQLANPDEWGYCASGRKVRLKHHSDGRALAADDDPSDEPRDFPCDNANAGCDGRVRVEGKVCYMGCNCHDLEREAHRLIDAYPGVDRALVGRVVHDGGLVITVRLAAGCSAHAVHLAIAQALWSSDITRGYAYSLVIL